MMMWHDVHSRDFDRNKLDELGNFKLHSFSHPDKDRMLSVHNEEQKIHFGV